MKTDSSDLGKSRYEKQRHSNYQENINGISKIINKKQITKLKCADLKPKIWLSSYKHCCYSTGPGFDYQYHKAVS